MYSHSVNASAPSSPSDELMTWMWIFWSTRPNICAGNWMTSLTSAVNSCGGSGCCFFFDSFLWVWHDRTWEFKLVAWENVFSQIEHLNGFSAEWTCSCLLSLLLFVNDLSQDVHLYGLSPLWDLKWIFNWLPRVNVFSHWGQEYGRSPEWVLICSFKWLLWVAPWLHTSHRNLYSFRCWVLRWIRRFTGVAKVLSHSEHL